MLPLNQLAGAVTLSPAMSRRMAALYSAMEEGYDAVAVQLGLTCRGCPDNCCDSFFLHHTFVEWAYLWEGLHALPVDELDAIKERAAGYVRQSRDILARGGRPQLPCPLLTGEGLCGLYRHRLMICRMHGVPNELTMPDGGCKRFSGCFRCQGLIEGRREYPLMERTALFQNLVQLEQELFGGARNRYPRVKLTIAEMITSGPPRVAGLSQD